MGSGDRVLAAGELREEGFSLLREFDGDRLLEFAAEFGEPIADRRNPCLVRAISPQRQSEASPNTLSSRFGLGAFPFHTDVAHWEQPADFVMLYCLDPGAGRRETILLDTQSWRLCASDERTLCNAVWKTTSIRRPFLCTVASRKSFRLTFRYDQACMMPMSKSAHDAQKIIEANLSGSPRFKIAWEKRDLLIIDNSRVLHARGPVEVDDTNRVLQRVLVRN